MEKKVEMCMYIDKAISACQASLQNNSYELYFERYGNLLNRLNRIKEAVIEDNLYTEISDLSIVKIIIENDPKALIDAVLRVNQYFRLKYSSVL